jgi:hypothetical protein
MIDRSDAPAIAALVVCPARRECPLANGSMMLAMDHFEHPSMELWEQRRVWIESLAQPPSEWAGYTISEQAAALTADVRAAFCAGAWVAVIVLAAAVIDAQLREDALPGFRGNSKSLIANAGLDERYQNLRKRRNTLVHVDIENPSLTVDNQWSDRSSLEQEARGSVCLMFETFWLDPWV